MAPPQPPVSGRDAERVSTPHVGRIGEYDESGSDRTRSETLLRRARDSAGQARSNEAAETPLGAPGT
jgi:hypothetical protein